MSDQEQIMQLYHDMYAAMVAKDGTELNRLHEDSFILVHMTGMHQGKQEYIRAILDGTLNYYSEHTEGLDIDVSGDKATMTGRSRVNAAVFGGGKHTWPLQLRFTLIKRKDGWKLSSAQASTY